MVARWEQIVFDGFPDENADIYVVDSQGGAPRKLTKEPSNENVPSWSRDGGWIYFASDRTGGWEVWKMPSTGGRALQVTRHGGFAAFESPDGKFLYYAKRELPGLWRIPTNGGEEVEVIRSFESGNWGYWAVVDNGIYYLDLTDKPRIGSSISPLIAVRRYSIWRAVQPRKWQDWPSLRTGAQFSIPSWMGQVVKSFWSKTSDRLNLSGMHGSAGQRNTVADIFRRAASPFWLDATKFHINCSGLCWKPCPARLRMAGKLGGDS